MKQERSRLYFYDEEGLEIEIPSKFAVCPRCEGKGFHVNPNIDGHGLSREDFDEDPDFARDYLSGMYDVPCYECGGLRVVPVPDPERCSPEQLKAYEQHLKEEAEFDAAWRAEIRAGA